MATRPIKLFREFPVNNVTKFSLKKIYTILYFALIRAKPSFENEIDEFSSFFSKRFEEESLPPFDSCRQCRGKRPIRRRESVQLLPTRSLLGPK